MINRIRYRQFIKVRGGDFEVEYWGFLKHGFEPPLAVNGIYPESFQSTGLYDSTRTKEFPEGKEIWEGSILKWELHNLNGDAFVTSFGVVGWDNKKVQLICRSLEDDFVYGWDLVKQCATVIGDTTTTPELMEVKK